MNWHDRAVELASVEQICRQTTLRLVKSEPAIMEAVTVHNPLRLCGLDSGFFYFPLSMALYENPAMTAEDLVELGVNIALGHGHFAIMDRVIDEGRVNSQLVLLAQVMLELYLQRMEDRYGHQTSVRAAHRDRYREYALAALVEQRQKRQLRIITVADFELLGAKSAPACMPLRAILLDAGRSLEHAAQVERSFLDYCGALQLMDDLSDIVQDYRDGLSSIPINLILQHSTKLDRWPSDDTFSPEDLHALAFLSRTGSATLGLIERLLAKANRRAADVAVLPLLELIARRRDLLRTRRDAISRASV